MQDRASKKPSTDRYLRAEPHLAHLAHQQKDYSNGTDKNRQGADDLRGDFDERAAILEYDAGLPRPKAELAAARITVTYAWNQGYLWASLRAALAPYPSLLAQLPDTDGPVDALPLGTAKVAVLKGRRVGRSPGRRR